MIASAKDIKSSQQAKSYEVDIPDSSSVEEDKDLSHLEIRDLIDEINHQIQFLDKSQVELLDAIRDFPNDSDFSSAYWENDQVIKKKKEILGNLYAQLNTIDPAFFRELQLARNIFNDQNRRQGNQHDQQLVESSSFEGSSVIPHIEEGEPASSINVEGLYL